MTYLVHPLDRGINEDVFTLDNSAIENNTSLPIIGADEKFSFLIFYMILIYLLLYFLKSIMNKYFSSLLSLTHIKILRYKTGEIAAL